MIDPGLNALRVWMIISVFLYAPALLMFLFGQNLLLRNINRASQGFFGDRFNQIPESTEKFWLVLTNSMMVMLVTICIFVAVNPAQYMSMVVIILVSKFFSSAQYVYHFRRKKYFADMVGFLTDGPIFIVTLIIYIYAIA